MNKLSTWKKVTSFEAIVIMRIPFSLTNKKTILKGENDSRKLDLTTNKNWKRNSREMI